MKINYTKPYGIWKVTTEGDEEGRTTRELGVYEGYVDEIAFNLRRMAGYGLTFHKLSDKKPEGYASYCHREGAQSHISFDIDSKTWDMSKQGQVAYFQKVFRGRPVTVVESNYYASVLLKFQVEKPLDALAHRLSNENTNT